MTPLGTTREHLQVHPKFSGKIQSFTTPKNSIGRNKKR
jgi:hypothetical protein